MLCARLVRTVPSLRRSRVPTWPFPTLFRVASSCVPPPSAPQWDVNGDGVLRKREFLVTMKHLLRDEERWRAVTRSLADKVRTITASYSFVR